MESNQYLTKTMPEAEKKAWKDQSFEFRNFF